MLNITKFGTNSEYDFINKKHTKIFINYLSRKDFKLPLWYEPKNKERYLEKIKIVYKINPLLEDIYKNEKNFTKPEIGFHLYILTKENNYKNILTLSNNEDISDILICNAFKNPETQSLTSIFNKENLYVKDLIENSNLRPYYTSIQSKEIFMSLFELKNRAYKYDLIFINNLTSIDEYIVNLHIIDSLTNIGACIVINNIDKEKVEEFVRYITINYSHYTILPNTFVSEQCVTFIKINNDQRPWYFHKDF
jgi:hypothetical protein